MPKHPERLQKNAPFDGEDEKPVDVKPLVGLGDRRRNPHDLEPDAAAMRAGMEHGGTTENKHEGLLVRGTGGRKRSGNYSKHPGRDLSKKR